MAENFGIFIGVPPVKQVQITHREQGAHLMATMEALYLADLNGADKVPTGLDTGNVGEMPVLDELGVRTGLARLGVDLPAGEDEAWWEHGTVGYELLLCRGEDGRLRMVDGTMRYLTLGGTKSMDVRAVFIGLLELAEALGARFWQTGGVEVPEPVDRDVVDWWVREMSGDRP